MILLNFLLTIYCTNKVIFRNAFGTIAVNMDVNLYILTLNSKKFHH